MTEHQELEKLVAEAKAKLQTERPARENIDALLAEAAERRAKADSIEKRIKQQRIKFRETEQRLDLIFIICFVVAGLFAVIIFLAAFIGFIKWLFW